jgi:hypothetical protein
MSFECKNIGFQKKSHAGTIWRKKTVGRPRSRWEDAVQVDVERLLGRQLREIGKSGGRSVGRPGHDLLSSAIR